MDYYTLFKTLHILSAVFWIGGSFGLAVAGTVALRSGDGALVIAIGRIVALLGPRLFVPASLLTLGFGVSMVIAGGLPWEAWLVLGLAGTLGTALYGTLVLKPLSETAAALSGDRARRADALRVTTELLRRAAFDHIALLAVVVVMVAKPGWEDTALLGGLTAAAALAALALAVFGRRIAAHPGL